jgi:hypothetical protein
MRRVPPTRRYVSCAGVGEGALHQARIAAGAFDGDEAISELVFGEGLANARHGGVEAGQLVFDVGGG